MDITKNDLITKILSGEFEEAKVLIHYFSKEKLKAILVDLAYDSENFIAYAFVLYLIQDKESVELHRVAFTLLSIAFFFLEGGYQCALYHMRRATELSQDDGILEENLLFLHMVPEKVVSDKEARAIAHKILLTEPNNEVALERLRSLDRDHEQEIEEDENCAEQTINEALKEAIIAGEFLEAKKKMPIIPLELLTTILMEIAHEEESICSYAFVCFLMLVEKESAAYHSLAADILENALPDITGSPETAQYHKKRAIELLKI